MIIQDYIMKKIKRFIKIFFIKYFDFYYYKNEKYLDFLKYLFTYNKKLKFNNTVVKIPIKSFFTYIFFNRVFDNYEKNNIKLFEFLVKKFNVFIDVGANFGLYSMLFSSKKNKSLSIELNL